MECYAPGEAVGQTAYSSIVGLLAERIEYETPLQKSYMHQGYSFNYLVNEDGLCFMVSGGASRVFRWRVQGSQKKKTHTRQWPRRTFRRESALHSWRGW